MMRPLESQVVIHLNHQLVALSQKLVTLESLAPKALIIDMLTSLDAKHSCLIHPLRLGEEFRTLAWL